MIKNIIKSKIFSGAIGTGKTTNMINELQGVIRDNPNILIYVYEELPEIHNAFHNEHITDILTENVDLIVGPTVPKLPHKIGDELTPMEMYAYDVLTVIANLAGIPAGSIKAGEVDGIPVGLQIQAKPLDDLKIIKAMSVFENEN